MPTPIPGHTATPPTPIRLGVSACLLGQEVRFDGGHKQDRYVLDILAGFVELVAVCPEVEAGMSIPRPTVRLEGDPESPRMRAPSTGEDWTARMTAYSGKRAGELAAEELCGFVFKKNSPSCGVWRVKVYGEKGMPAKTGRGLFAAALIRRCPLLPVEEEGRLHDPLLRENFLERVFAYHRLRGLFGGRWKRGDVVAFHSREKFLLLAHSPKAYKELGQLVAAVKQHTPAAFRDRYMASYMQALEAKATPSRQVNVLQHLAGYLREHLSSEEQHRVLAVVEDYRAGLVPLIVPMTLLKHYIGLHGVDYVAQQSYLNPHPKELMLRNHV